MRLTMMMAAGAVAMSAGVPAMALQADGFRIATPGQPAQEPTRPAPPTKSFRVARPAGAPAVKPTRAPRRVYVPVSHLVVTPVPGTPRENLLLTFEGASAQLTPAAEVKARGFAQALMMPELKDKRFMVAGHTDAHGARDANIDLSRRRAQSVADFLVAQGVDPARVEVRGFGPDEPLPGREAASEANSRIEAVLIS